MLLVSVFNFRVITGRAGASVKKFLGCFWHANPEPVGSRFKSEGAHKSAAQRVIFKTRWHVLIESLEQPLNTHAAQFGDRIEVACAWEASAVGPIAN